MPERTDMYLKKLTLINTGPISRAVLDFPMRSPATNSARTPKESTSAESPMPVLLVGENGSGKSICLSHIVSTMMALQQSAYPESPEVKAGKVYKYRSPTYIKTGADFHFCRIEFYGGQKREELVLSKLKKHFTTIPEGIPSDFSQWKSIDSEQWDHLGVIGNFEARKFFDENCVLYFPPNRFEDPAWLNAEHLNSKIELLGTKNIVGHSDRLIIAESPMRINQNWLFEVIFDQLCHENIHANFPLQVGKDRQIPVPVILRQEGEASNLHNAANSIVKTCLRKNGNPRIVMGRRQNRTLMLFEKIGNDDQIITPNIFQLSAGETALLNLFLSILRDFDMSGSGFKALDQIQGIVIVDEIDLHLHAVHQYEVLPALIKMFPRVQFILTSHSPLFVLGMRELFKDDGFILYRLPEGRKINPEEFSEFESAYHVFRQTQKFENELREQIQNSQKPILVTEGKTDMKYLRKAAKLFGQTALLDKVDIKDGRGKDNLNSAWNFLTASQSFEQTVILLFDCDAGTKNASNRTVHKIYIPRLKLSPVRDGIENRFSEKTLRKVPPDVMGDACITTTTRKLLHDNGKKSVSESWQLDKPQKSALCDWLCEHGDKSDFQHFDEIFDMLEEILAQ